MTPKPLLAVLCLALAAGAQAGDDEFLRQAAGVGRELAHVARRLPGEIFAPKPGPDVPRLRIGFMIGIFDPPHAGHLRAVETAMGELGLDRLVFAPHTMTVHKPHASPLKDRLEMARLAMAGRAGVEVRALSLLELLLEAKSVLASLDAACRPDGALSGCFLILGADAFEDHFSGNRILLSVALRSFRIVVVDRPGSASAELAADPRFRLLADPNGVELSSTRLRAMIARGESVRGLVPDAVADYIRRRRLYTGMVAAGP